MYLLITDPKQIGLIESMQTHVINYFLLPNLKGRQFGDQTGHALSMPVGQQGWGSWSLPRTSLLRWPHACPLKLVRKTGTGLWLRSQRLRIFPSLIDPLDLKQSQPPILSHLLHCFANEIQWSQLFRTEKQNLKKTAYFINTDMLFCDSFCKFLTAKQFTAKIYQQETQLLWPPDCYFYIDRLHCPSSGPKRLELMF